MFYWMKKHKNALLDAVVYKIFYSEYPVRITVDDYFTNIRKN